MHLSMVLQKWSGVIWEEINFVSFYMFCIQKFIVILASSKVIGIQLIGIHLYFGSNVYDTLIYAAMLHVKICDIF